MRTYGLWCLAYELLVVKCLQGKLSHPGTGPFTKLLLQQQSLLLWSKPRGESSLCPGLEQAGLEADRLISKCPPCQLMVFAPSIHRNPPLEPWEALTAQKGQLGASSDLGQGQGRDRAPSLAAGLRDLALCLGTFMPCWEEGSECHCWWRGGGHISDKELRS